MQTLSVLAILLVCTFAHLNHHTHPEREGLTPTRSLFVKHPLHGV